MTLLRTLQLLTVALVVLSAAMLGLGQEEPWFTYTIAMAALIAFALNDWFGWFYIHRYIANVAMLGTAIAVLNDFFSLSSREQLVAIGELLVYVQLILLIQKKNERIYGQVAIFSLLAVVVAALLTHSPMFGLLLVAYTVTGTYALALFSIHRGMHSVGFHFPRWRKQNRLLTQIKFAPMESSQRVDAELRQWGVRKELAAVAVATLLFGATFFYTLPRVGGIGWEEGGFAGAKRVGFSPEITFDEMGTLLQSNQMVMRVTFRRARTDTPYTIITNPYFRGAVLTRYVLERGQPRWKRDVSHGFTGSMRLPRPKPTNELVAVDTLLEPTRDARLFYIYPAYSSPRTPPNIRFNPRLQALYRQQESDQQLTSAKRAFRFETVTTAFRYGLQTPVTPHINPVQTVRQRFALEAEKRRLLRMEPEDYDQLGRDEAPRDRFPGLRKLAKQIVAERAPNGNRYDQALALQDWFLDPGRFTYTLDLNEIRARRRPELDPVEDFVVHHRHGHCQYFASALALMLRSLGIPSRIVVGYRGGELNQFGQYYIVRQRDAHAWVEAYLEPDEIPINAMLDVERHAGGGWLRLDPTPARLSESTGARNVLDRVTDSFDYAKWLWNDYVLNLSREQQQASGLGQIDPSADEWDWTRLITSPPWQSASRERRTDPKNFGGAWRQWWKWALIGMAGGVTALLVHFRKRLRRRRRKRAGTNPLPSIAYYRRLESLLRRFGCQRSPGTTPREFALQAGTHLQELLGDSTVGTLPDQVVQAYYQDRFRPEGAPRGMVQAASDALRRLESAYHDWKRTRRHRAKSTP